MERHDPGGSELQRDERGEYVLDSADRHLQETEPNFVLPRHNAIGENNWAEYERQGFVVVDPLIKNESLLRHLKFRQTMFGTENVYTGQPFDAESQKPVDREDGKGIYASPNGIAHWERLEAWRREKEAAEGSTEPDDSRP